MTATSKFVAAFDPANIAHVDWFKKMTDYASNLHDPNASHNLVAMINANPMNVKIEDRDALDWFHIHFVLCATYAKAVLKGVAHIPVPS
jgi:hypothetical protein